MSACPEAPKLAEPRIVVEGGPFTDCGMGPVGLRAPFPTMLPHGFGDRGYLNGTELCIQPFTPQSWWVGNGQPDLPDVKIPDSDRVIHNSAVFEGDVIFTGERVQWKSQPGFGAVKGEYRCAPGAKNIEVDGVCLCAVPEPGLLPALAVGLIGLALAARTRSRTSGGSRGNRCR